MDPATREPIVGGSTLAAANEGPSNGDGARRELVFSIFVEEVHAAESCWGVPKSLKQMDLWVRPVGAA
jgi:hypothetical protein